HFMGTRSTAANPPQLGWDAYTPAPPSSAAEAEDRLNQTIQNLRDGFHAANAGLQNVSTRLPPSLRTAFHAKATTLNDQFQRGPAQNALDRSPAPYRAQIYVDHYSRTMHSLDRLRAEGDVWSRALNYSIGLLRTILAADSITSSAPAG